MRTLTHTLHCYEQVIEDLKFQAPFYEAPIFEKTIAVLEARVSEFKNEWADELAEEQLRLEISKALHPANRMKRIRKAQEEANNDDK